MTNYRINRLSATFAVILFTFLMIVGGIVLVTTMIDNAGTLERSLAAAQPPELLDKVAFPDGWRPVTCNQTGAVAGGCFDYLCVNDQGTYRICKATQTEVDGSE